MKEKFEGTGVVDMGVWVEALCPARLDLAGGWSDTPPICYEQGGAVLNVAIKVSVTQMSDRVQVFEQACHLMKVNTGKKFMLQTGKQEEAYQCPSACDPRGGGCVCVA